MSLSINTPLVFLDTETSSLGDDREAWEIAAVRRDPDGTEMRLHAFLPIDLTLADPISLDIGGYYTRHPYPYVEASANRYARLLPIDCYQSRAEAALAVAIMTRGAHIVGVNPTFDVNTLAPMMRREGVIPGWHYHLIDVGTLMLGYLQANGYEIPVPWKTDDLAAVRRVEPPTKSQRHTAMGDVEWTMRIFDRIATNPDSKDQA